MLCLCFWILRKLAQSHLCCERGRENFQIGGVGSGETYCLATKCDSFRGGMCWSDRGSVFSPKASTQPDSFTNSLRKYPNISQDRSSEIVERLICYTQAKHSAIKQRSNVSPTRNMDSDMSNQTINMDVPSRNITSPKYPRQLYEPDVRSKRLQESPTRERSRRGPVDQETLEAWRRSTFCRTNDVRCLRDVSRKVRDGIRTLSHQSNCQPEKLNSTRERCEPHMIDKGLEAQSNTNSVNMEIQVAVQMVSREVVTVPIPVPSQRTIAVPLTPSPSRAEPDSEVSKLPSELTVVLQTDFDRQEISTTKPSREFKPAISAIELSDSKLKQYKGSKSQDEIKTIQNELLIIQDLHLGPCCSKFHRKSHSRINKSNKFLIKFAKNPESVSKHGGKLYEHKCSRLTNNSKELKRFQSYARIYNAKVTPYKTSDENDLADILDDWLDLIPLKPKESCGRKFDKEFIFYDFFDCLKYYVSKPLESNRKYKLKTDILDKLDTLPTEIKGNRRAVLSRLADILINKVKHIGCKKSARSTDSSRRELEEFKEICSSISVGYVPPTESELKIFISSELILYLEKTCLKMNRHKIKDLENDLLDCLMISIEEIRFGCNRRVRKSVFKILRDHGFSECQSTLFANLLITNLEQSFINDAVPSRIRSETLIVLPNIQHVARSRKSTAHNSKVSIESKKNKNNIALDRYTNELCRQIDEWLSSLKLQIPENRENELRQVIINDLAGDIMDRHKYLELNPTSRGSDETELEHLRYQIYKWISKLVGEDNLIPKDHAPELMTRIRGLPMFSNCHDNSNSYHASNQGDDVGKKPFLSGSSRSDNNIKLNKSSPGIKHEPDFIERNKNEKIPLGVSVSTSSRDINVMTMSIGSPNLTFRESYNKIRCNQNSKAVCCIDLKNSSQSMKSVEQLEAEYQQFVKDWVQKVPIKTISPDQAPVVERARVELHNSLWKIVSKLNCDPATYYNCFFYEDLLDDAIEDLLDCLPQTQEMKSVRLSLKVEFIEKTVNLYDHIRAHEDASFKNKLVKNVITNLRTHGIIDNEREESIKQHEDLQIIKLVEEYLLYTRFKNDNKLISDVFKKKLTREIGNFVEDLKKNHDKEFRNVDTSSYKSELMNALEKVPLPNERTIKEEADDILLGLEVEQWYTDLPVVPNEDSINTYHTKMQLDMLTMKIKEIENSSSTDDSETVLRNEITKFLEKTPLKEGQRLNLNFMVDELINRVKNMQKQDKGPNNKKVIFQAPDSYDEFGKNIPFASSYIETSPSYQNRLFENNLSNNKAQRLSSNGHDLNIITETPTYQPHDIVEPSSYRRSSEESPTSSSFKESADQWHSLKDSQIHTPRQNIINNTQRYSIPTSSYAPREYQRDRSLNGVQSKSINQNCHPNINHQRVDILGNSQTQPSFLNKDPRMSSLEEPSSFQYNPQTSEGIGISQVAGPSGYRTGQFELPQAYPPSSHQIPNAAMYSTDDHRSSIANQSGILIKQTQEDREKDQANKSSIGCQSFRNDGIEKSREDFKNKIDKTFDTTKRLSVATSTGQISDIQFTAPKPSVNKRRPKWAMTEKEGVKRRSTETDDEDDDYHCRCIERYWKCRRRPKYLSSEDFDDYPPCFPIFFPYPCFL
ncbi:uncharacterized protein LOC123879152 isoform X2 [Maniola jurtina]|uniref:uncharacterized protein LOC123879152 isoform X2 n=1 Tax=Maniola jurtina TaxID=191418 RepID=UPI001E68DD53|nr:uncharacterized protein LOC123879152 isoform X2 [Maniola jurtina]